VDATGLQQADSFNFKIVFNVAQKVAGSSEPASYDFTHATVSTNMAIAAYSGASSVDVFSKSASIPNPGSNVRTLTGVTTTQANDMLVGMAFDWADNTNNEEPPTGMTERQDAVLTSVWDQVIAAAGATGTRSNTCNSATSSPNGGFLVALKGA
jgi:hypothetical protein